MHTLSRRNIRSWLGDKGLNVALPPCASVARGAYAYAYA